MNSRELIIAEMAIVSDQIKNSLSSIKRLAVGEAWKILQIITARTIQTIERIGVDLESPDKKALAMEIISAFYSKVFVSVDIPFIPNAIEPMIHKYVKAFLMILVNSTIDALVATFRDAGIFLRKNSPSSPDGSYNTQKSFYIP